MKKLAILSLVSVLSLTAFALPPIEKGDRVPDFTATDESGDLWTLSDQRAAYLVIYFYPAAFTGGCTAQACSYRDHESEFSRLNAKVIGVSGDEYENLEKFKEAHNLNFTLLSDPEGKIAEVFGVPMREGSTFETEVGGDLLQLTRGVTTSRWTFIVDGNKGRLIYMDEEVSAATDPEPVLKFITTHAKRKSCVL
jgi:peroxiredoxin Q/BCP